MDTTISLSIQKLSTCVTKANQIQTAFLKLSTKTKMKSLYLSTSSCCCNISPPLLHHQLIVINKSWELQRGRNFTLRAAKSGGFSLQSITSRCKTCKGQGAIECPGCKGTGKNKKNGNMFERWKCFECQGFGLKGCPVCGKGGLTPEQRGER